jgi:hypothetical protein
MIEISTVRRDSSVVERILGKIALRPAGGWISPYDSTMFATRSGCAIVEFCREQHGNMRYDLGDFWEDETMATRETPAVRHVYFIEAEGLNRVKIGSADDARKRLAQLQVGCPSKLVLRGVLHTDDATQLERIFHRDFAGQRVQGEWFKVNAKLRRIMEDAFEPEEDGITVAFRPSDVLPLVTVHWQPGDTNESFCERAYSVHVALGFGAPDEAGAA